MGRAFVCDMSGKMNEGAGLNNFQVELSAKLSLQITPLVKTGERQYGQGVISQESADRIKAALSALFEKEEKKK